MAVGAGACMADESGAASIDVDIDAPPGASSPVVGAVDIDAAGVGLAVDCAGDRDVAVSVVLVVGAVDMEAAPLVASDAVVDEDTSA